MDQREISILVLLDLSKCFDVVPHGKLLEKMNLYGIDTTWFSSYLRGHTQQVQVKTSHGSYIQSAKRSNTPGMSIFQGGSLSCILYLLFSNDLALFTEEDVTVVQYADDCQILVTGKKQDLPSLTNRMEKALNSLHQWFCQNEMKLNAGKTQMMVLGTPQMIRTLPTVTIKFCGSTIVDSRVLKNLGVTMDRCLSFESHMDSVHRKCTGILIALSHTRHTVPKQFLSTIVQGLALSVVRYCISIYGSCSRTQTHRVQKIINFAARVVSGRRRSDHISDVIRDLRWLNSQQLIQYHTVCALMQAVRSGTPQYLAGTIGQQQRDVHGRDTRSAHQLSLPRIRTEAGRRRLCYRGVKVVNDMGIDPRSCTRRALKAAIQDPSASR